MIDPFDISDYLKLRNPTVLGVLIYPVLAPVILLIAGWVVLTETVNKIIPKKKK